MSLNGIAGSAVSALKTNTAALGVVANNVSNINTPGYARRIVNEQTLSANGQLMGVSVASIQRVADQFLTQEALAAGGTASQYDAQANLFNQLNGLLGAPGDNQSLATGLTNLASAFATASQAPTSSAGRTGVMNALQSLAAGFSGVSSTISAMQGQIDGQVVSSIASTNGLLKQIYDLNTQIQAAQSTGDTASALEDQRDVALTTLSQTLGIKTAQQPDGSVNVATTDGINLVSNTYAQLSYDGGTSNGTYGNITVQDVNPRTGQRLASPTPLDPHLSGGSLKGMIDMRDQVLGGLSQSLGNLAKQTALAFNAQANANAAYPPPTSLSGRDTGLLGTDGLNFTSKTTVAVTDPSGNLVSRIDVDFDAGTLSVDGGGPVSIGSTVGSFTTALNGALGGNGSASFADGQLSISATGGNGVIVQDDASSPSLRGTTGFSQFFGLNDLFQAQAPSILSTGLTASDSAGVQDGGNISLALKGPDGDVVKQVSITTSSGQSVGDVVDALNTAMGGAATFTLNADGSISTATSALFPNYQLNVTNDTTTRGTTGMSFSRLFGLGANAGTAQAVGFSVTQAVSANPARIGFATPALTAASVAGDTVVSAGDNSGAIALENTISNSQNFGAAGGIAAQVSSLSDYAAGFYQNVSTQSNAVTANQTTQDDRLTEAQSRIASNSGVNLDEELTNLSKYQQAYSAGARLLTLVDQMYQTLLQNSVRRAAMSVDRVSSAAQTQYFLAQIERAGSALDKTQAQIASGKNANTYAGFGDKTQVLTASIAAQARNSAYTTATTLAVTQADQQDTQLSSLSDLATQLRKAVSDAVANNDGSTLMAQAQSIFDQAQSILNSKDANGDYIYSGGKTDVAPVSVGSLADLAALPAASDAFANGTYKKSVQVADGVTVSYGVTASDAGTGLMQSLYDLANFDTGPTGNLSASTNLTGPQSDYLTSTIAPLATVADNINTTLAQNGFVYNRLTDAQTQQTSMNTLYKGFISDIQDTNMADAATQLSLNQTQLQAALGVTSQLNQLSLLNYLPVSSGG